MLAVISSVASILPLGVCPAYSATKEFDAFYTKALRQLAVIRKADIKFTIIKPGFVDTDFIHGRHFPMTIRKEKAAAKIVCAIERKKKTAVTLGRAGPADAFDSVSAVELGRPLFQALPGHVLIPDYSSSKSTFENCPPSSLSLGASLSSSVRSTTGHLSFI